MRHSPWILAFFLLLGTASASTSKDFYCKKSPDSLPLYSPSAMKGCGPKTGAGAPEAKGACIYQRVGCLIIDDTVIRAAKLKFGKEFSALTTDEKEVAVQIVTPFLWVKTDARSLGAAQQMSEQQYARMAKNAEMDRLFALIDSVKDEKKKKELLALPKVEMFPSMLVCEAEGGKDPASTQCPPPEKCKEDAFYKPREVSISEANSDNTPDSPTLPGRVNSLDPQTSSGGG